MHRFFYRFGRALLGGLVFLAASSSVSAAARPSGPPPVRVVKLPVLQALLARPTDTTYIVNFWATWCKPCIEELPSFEAIRTAYATRKVKVLLVSLDFASKLKTKVEPFVEQKKLAAEVWLLNEPDANCFIDQIDPNWSGAIPFTLVVNNARRQRRAFERPLTQAELETELRGFGL